MRAPLFSSLVQPRRYLCLRAASLSRSSAIRSAARSRASGLFASYFGDGGSSAVAKLSRRRR